MTTMIAPDQTHTARPMNEQELAVVRILRARFHMVDSFAYEGPPIDFNMVAVEIVRQLISDAAFNVLVGGNKPTVQINIPGHCQCSNDTRLIKYGGNGPICQTCWLPA